MTLLFIAMILGLLLCLLYAGKLWGESRTENKQKGDILDDLETANKVDNSGDDIDTLVKRMRKRKK